VIDTGKSILSVSELNDIIKSRLETDPRLLNCYVAGEISNFKHHTSGHMYFTLKDEKSRLRAVMFASRTRNLPFAPQDGMRVICRGSIGVFDRDGQYQLYVDEMQPDGIGALYVAFTQLRERLAAEGLFADSRKRKLPLYPRRIGVVTSPTGAVIRDICSTLSRRYPLAKVILSPALVQGPEAAPTIVAGIRRLERLADAGLLPVDVIIVARGGGSLEELWPFNEEMVARAIASCSIPVISAVGHETDFTIADFVADVRAATPTAAAELVAPHVQELRMQVDQCGNRIQNALLWRLESEKRRLQAVEESPLFKQPLRLIDRQRQNVDYLESLLRRQISKPVALANRKLAAVAERLYRTDVKHKIARYRAQLEQIGYMSKARVQRVLADADGQLERYIATLEALNPLRVLSRGYSVVYRADKKSIVTSVSQVKKGDDIVITLSDGDVSAKISGEKEIVYGEQTRLDI
jgi:exodeoxyribonuclease VII large subunit